MKKQFLLLLAAILLPLSVSAESYLCIAEHAAGFEYDKNTKEWAPVLITTYSKFTVSKITEDNKFYGAAKWEVIMYGNNKFITYCKDDFDKHLLHCKLNFHGRDFKMNKDSMRFRIFLDRGYVVSQEYIDKGSEGLYRPRIFIGKCGQL